MVYDKEPKYIPVVVRGKTAWIDEETFHTMAEFRNERIKTGHRFKNGPTISDQYVDACEVLVPGGGVTVWELGGFTDGVCAIEKWFGPHWVLPEPGESRPNPAWMKDYYKEN